MKTRHLQIFSIHYILTTDDNGEINVSVNVSGRYQFKEIAAPSGYAMPTSVDTDVTRFRTSTTPVARMFHIKWDELFATGDAGGVTGGNVYFLNVDLSKNAAPIEINIDFGTASKSEPVNVGAPNVYFIAPENSPKKSTNFTQDVQNAPRMALTDAAVRSKYYNKVLWNYENATGKTIDVSSDTFFGTILAPASHLILDRGKNYGSVIADQVDLSGGEIYRWDLAYQPWTSSTDNITNNRIVTNVPSTLPITVNINFQKKWNDLDGATHSRNAITLELYQRVTDPDGTTHDSAVDDEKMTLSAKNSWQATFDSLPTRDGIGREIAYYAVEDESDSDYTPVYNGLPVTGDQPITVTNTQFGFDITKLATGGKTPLIGATYELTKLATDKTKSESWTLSTTAKTPTPLKVITPGTYVLKETKAPAGYQLDPKYYALKLSDKAPVVANSNYQFEEAFLDPEKVTNLETATVAAKDPANWIAIPKAAVDGFATDSNATKTNLVHFFQSDDLLPLTVTKVADDGSTPLAGATFSWQQVGSNTAAKTYTTNDKGQLINNSGTEETANFSMQPDAVYQLQETKAPTGYKLNDTALYVKNGKLVDKAGSTLTTVAEAALPASIKATDDAYALTFKDEPDAKPWLIKVVKVDADSGDKLDGASFKLAGSNDDSQTLKPTAKDGDTSSTLTMDADYTLSETVPPTGYATLDGDVTITTSKTDDPPTIKWQGNAVGEADTQTVYQKVDAKSHVVTITVKDRKKGTLPSTGGTGFLRPLELAISIFIASALMFALAWWQKQKAGDAQ